MKLIGDNLDRKALEKVSTNTSSNIKGFSQHTTHSHGPLALDSTLVQKLSKRHFFQDIKNSFHGVTRMGLEPHQNFFQFFFQQIWSLEEFKVFAY